VTAILPRRSYNPVISRLLHDRTADKIAGVVSRVPNAAATIIPFDVQNRVRVLQERHASKDAKAAAVTGAVMEAASGKPGAADARPPKLSAADADSIRHDLAAGMAAATPADASQLPGAGSYLRPTPPADVNPIGTLRHPGDRAVVEGRVRVVEIRPVERNSVLVAEISDSTGDLAAMFYGRQEIPGMICGARVRFRGTVGIREGKPVMVNPAYELVAPGQSAGKGRKSAADEG
jgi:hypothetical protein